MLVQARGQQAPRPARQQPVPPQAGLPTAVRTAAAQRVVAELQTEKPVEAAQAEVVEALTRELAAIG